MLSKFLSANKIWVNVMQPTNPGMKKQVKCFAQLIVYLILLSAVVLVPGPVSASTGSAISRATAIFNKDTTSGSYDDISVTMSLSDGAALTNIENGTNPLTQTTDYTVSGNTVTILKSYLAALSEGKTTLTFDFSDGSSPTLIISVVNVDIKMYGPLGVAVDSENNVYYTSCIGSSTIIAVVPASSGSRYGVAMTAGKYYILAILNNIHSYTMDVDENGNIFLGDSESNIIYEVSAATGTQWGSVAMTAGEIYNIAGAGGIVNQQAFNGIGGVAVDNSGNLYIADSGNNQVLEIAAVTGNQWGTISMTIGSIYTIVSSYQLAAPGGLAVDSSGNLFIADYGHYRICKMLTDGSISTAAGGASSDGADGGAAGNARLAPRGVAVDSSGNLYIAEGACDRVREVAAADGGQWGISMKAGCIYTVVSALSGMASTMMQDPSDVAVDGAGNLYITTPIRVVVQSKDPNRLITPMLAIRDKNPNGGAYADLTISTDPVFGTLRWILDYKDDNGPAWSQSGNTITIPKEHFSRRSAGTAYLTLDFYSGLRVNLNVVVIDTSLYVPQGLYVDEGGNYYIPTTNYVLVEVPASDGYQWGVNMTAGKYYAIAGNSVAGYSGDGAIASIQAQFSSGICRDSSGNLITSRINQWAAKIAADQNGNLYFLDTQNKAVREVASKTGTQWGDMSIKAGNIYTVAGNGTGGAVNGIKATQATFGDYQYLAGIAVDSSGNLYIADYKSNVVREVAASTGTQWGDISMEAGKIYTIAGGAGKLLDATVSGAKATAAHLNNPSAITVDTSGNLYIADYSSKVHEVAATDHEQWGVSMEAGRIYTIAGNGTAGNSGDAGAAASASINRPRDVAVDKFGNLYIVDNAQSMIREVAASSGTQWGQSMTAGYIYTVYTVEADTDGNPLYYIMDLVVDKNDSLCLILQKISDHSGQIIVKEIGSRGSISGMITDGSTPVSGATVSVTVSGTVYSATTASDGTYTINSVPVGSGYTVTADKSGGNSGSVSNISVTAGGTNTVNIIITCPATYQGVQKRFHSGTETYDFRFLATINTLEPDAVGFVYSTSETAPTRENVSSSQVLSTTVVYTSIIAAGNKITAESLGGSGAYIIACTLTGITNVDTTIYVRAFATKGSITTYTPVKTIKLKEIVGLTENSQVCGNALARQPALFI